MTNPDEVSLVEKASFAWTATEGYKHFPVFVNLTGNRLAVRGREVFNGRHYEQGLYLAVELPDDAINELREALAATPLVKMREALEARDRVIAAAADAIDIADNIIAVNMGTDTPKEWDRAFRKVTKARAALSSNLEGG